MKASSGSILVCPLSKVASMLDAHRPERIVSVLDPDFAFPDTGPEYADRHLRLHFHDTDVARAGVVMPGSDHVDALLAFVAAWSRAAPILIHCRAGIGRSTATAFITACLHSPRTDELEVAIELRRVAPLSRPNEALIALADAAMGRRGRMCQAIADTGRDLSWTDVKNALRLDGEGKPFELRCTFDPAPD